MGNSISKKDSFLIALFQNLRNDIEYIKRQQWAVTNYGILLYGAIISLFVLFIKSSNSIACIWKCSIVVIALGICFICFFVIDKYSIRLKIYRKAVNKIEEHFKNKVVDFKDDDDPQKDRYILFIFYLVLIFGWIAVSLVVFLYKTAVI